MATQIDAPQDAATEAQKHSSSTAMLAARMPDMVKGVGYASPGGNTPLGDRDEILRRSYDAETALVAATKQGISSPETVKSGINPAFSSQFGLFMGQVGADSGMQTLTAQLQDAFADLGKNITLTSPLSTGLVPFDLAAPSRLIYPVYTPLRNKLPRTKGQGTSARVKVITGITGSQTGASGGAFQRTSMPELPNTLSGTNWPLNLPASGTQDSVELNVPYKFFGLSESLSWLAQFAGQGFEDISALANLILLQEMMMADEANILAGRSTALAAPAQPTGTARSAAAGETALTGMTTNIYVRVTSATMLGESVVGTASAAIAVSAGQVVDVVIPHVLGATGFNVYVSTGASDPGAASSWFMVRAGGGGTVTLQGALPTTGKAASTVTDTSFSTNDFDGLLSILAGQAGTGAYPAGFKGGYVNGAVGGPLTVGVLNTAAQQLWDGPGAFRADPQELIAEGSDVKNLAADLVANGHNQNAYMLTIGQPEVSGVRVGAAVSEFQNPITRSVVKIVVHPWLPQGNALLMSYTLPTVVSHVSNAWEMRMVQDYLSINWPVIDASYRYSIYEYGALLGQAPQYSGLLQGITPS